MVTKGFSSPFYVLTGSETDADHSRFRIQIKLNNEIFVNVIELVVLVAV